MLNGKLYVVGGHINQTHHYAANNFTDVVDVFDLATCTWGPRLSPRPRPSQGFFLAAYGQYLYAFGGLVHQPGPTPQQSYISVSDIDRYDTLTDTWITVGQLSGPRSSNVGGVVGGVAYVIGGWYGNPSAGPVGGYFLDTVEAFDLATETITTLPTKMPAPLRRACGASADQHGIAIVGGITNTTDPNTMALSEVLYFLPKGSATHWFSGLSLPSPTFAPGVGRSSSGELYVFGGWQGNQPLSPNFTNQVFKLPNGVPKWVQMPSMTKDKGFVDVVNLDATSFGLLGGALDPAQSGYQTDAFDRYLQPPLDDEAATPLIIPPRH